MTCRETGCQKEANVPGSARGFCRRHYVKWNREHHEEIRPRFTLEESFWLRAQIPPDPDQCWGWTGSVHGRGYPMVYGGSNRELAHRLSYRLHIGPIPDGMELDHTCHNGSGCTDDGPSCPHRRCTNPRHLEAVTHQVNAQRGRAGEHNALKTHCRNGHPLSGDNLRIETYGSRRCKACARAANARYQAKRRSAA